MSITTKQIKVEILEAIPSSPLLSRLNTYHYTVLELSEPTWVNFRGQRTLITSLEWDDSGLSQWLVANNGIRYRLAMVTL